MGPHRRVCRGALVVQYVSNAAVLCFVSRPLVFLLLPVFAKQKLQPLCCYLLPAGGAPQSPPLQFPRRAASGRSPAAAQHHRRADGGQGERGGLAFFKKRQINKQMNERLLHPRLPDQSSAIHTCTFRTQRASIHFSGWLPSSPALLRPPPLWP